MGVYKLVYQGYILAEASLYTGKRIGKGITLIQHHTQAANSNVAALYVTDKAVE